MKWPSAQETADQLRDSTRRAVEGLRRFVSRLDNEPPDLESIESQLMVLYAHHTLIMTALVHLLEREPELAKSEVPE